MARPDIRQASELQRKATVPDEDRTPSRDDVADWIEEHVVDGERDWQQWTITEIAESLGCSRQHVADTLDAYFDPANKTRGMAGLPIEADAADGDFWDGFTAGVEWAKNNPELLQ